MSGTEYWLVYSIATGAFHMKGSGATGSFAQQELAAGDVGILVPFGLYYAATPDKDTVAAAIWDFVKARRDAIISGGAVTPIGVVDTDIVSRTNISGAALGATIAKAADQPFAIVWTDQANALHDLDADGMIAVGLAVLAHVGAAHDKARLLRVAIDEATDLSALLSIDILSGWPA